MAEQRPGEGGPANTPPFPRIVNEESAPTPFAGGDPEPVGGGGGIGEAGGHAGEILEPVTETPSPAGARESLNRAAEAGDEALEAARSTSERIRRMATDAGEEVRRRAEKGVNRGFERVAERVDTFADRVEELADRQLSGTGTRARAGDLAHGTAGVLDNVAEYLRSTDLRGLQADLENQVRTRPLQTLLVAAAAGWVFGKIMR
jgi:ElaB/YqjD/DUF883 family membrane-anchored ribosome-binding protein